MLESIYQLTADIYEETGVPVDKVWVGSQIFAIMKVELEGKTPFHRRTGDLLPLSMIQFRGLTILQDFRLRPEEIRIN
jgi:hypothetical protein